MNKISVARFINLAFITGFSIIFATTFVASLHMTQHFFHALTSSKDSGLSDKELFLPPFYWCGGIILTAVIAAGSPVGDKVASLFFSIRKKSLREDEKINPALERIKTLYREKFFKDLDIDVHVMDVPTINGLALGQRTAALSTGLLKTANDDQIAAILAHEVGHLHYRDGFFNLCLLTASIPTIFLNALCGLFFGGSDEKSSSSGGAVSALSLFSIFFIFFMVFMSPFLICCLVSIPVLWLMRSVEVFTEWPIEYRADKFAMDMGFGPALVELFEHTEDEDIRNTTGFLSKYLYSHPPTALRIDRVERVLLAEGQNPYPAAEMKAAA